MLALVTETATAQVPDAPQGAPPIREEDLVGFKYCDAVEMLRFYFMGWATEQELEAHIAKLKKRDE